METGHCSPDGADDSEEEEEEEEVGDMDDSSSSPPILSPCSSSFSSLSRLKYNEMMLCFSF